MATDSAKGVYEGELMSSGNKTAEFDLNSSFVHALHKQRDPVVREEVALQGKDAEALPLAETLSELGSEVVIPLRLQERLIGFILIGKKRNRDVFSAEDLRLLSNLGDEVAVALENARLYEDLKRSQQLLARSDRLAALGTLAAGIAHEIRNPLVSIHTFTQLLPERLDDPEFRTNFLQLASREIARATDLISNLLDFARPSPAVIRDVDLNNVVLEQIVQLLGGQAKKKGVSLIFSPSPFLLPVLADEGQVKQVFMNLVLNALQATPTGGEVTVTTQAFHDQSGKEYYRVEVRDTGDGIPPEHKEQIFDPFFTTKDSGVGLGLFIAHQIVAEHGGYIDVESVVGEGTNFCVYLPYAQEQTVETEGVTPDAEQIEKLPWLKTGTGRQ